MRGGGSGRSEWWVSREGGEGASEGITKDKDKVALS